ncbi:MAG: rRNA maturation RNase YbeY [Eggerthellaceae bacterium]|nr:rRNA maturation RNase YbeY [Eggerthellaceae bacterium]MDR2715319.1 rRNA maturation RNase YbeY [Coriobacteriaceae bacterium]
MEVHLNFEHGEGRLSPLPLRELALFVLAHQGLPPHTEVSVTFVTDERMAELNEEFRGIAGATDVLSFECDGTPGSEPGGAAYLLGDVVIAPDVAACQAQEFSTGFAEEVSLLLVHGLLHLCGHDHQEENEAQGMEDLEGDILGTWAQQRQ